MKRIITLLVMGACTLVNLHAQLPSPSWAKTIGGSGTDVAKQVRMQGDKIITVGYSSSFDGDWDGTLMRPTDMFITRMDLNGNIEMKKRLGGNGYDISNAVEVTSDGGYIMAGVTNSTDGHADGGGYHGGHGYDMWVVRVGVTGSIKWQRALGGTNSEEALAVIQTDDDGDGRKNDGFLIVGFTESTDGDVKSDHGGYIDAWVVKLDSEGNLEWEKCLGGSRGEYGRDVKQTPDGGFLIISETYSPDILGYHQLPSANYGQYADWWLVKLDATGNLLWDKAWGGNYSEIPHEIQLTDDDGDGRADDGFIIVGNGESRDGDVPMPAYGSWDMFVVKFDMDAKEQWKLRIGGSSSENAYSVVQTLDGGFAVAGRTGSTDGSLEDTEPKGQTDWLLLKLTAAGGIEWKERFGGSLTEDAYSLQQTPAGCFVLAGYTESSNGDVTDFKGVVDAWLLNYCPPPPTLPVTLTNFNARYEGDGKSVLEWNTETEVNNDRFEIQRSVDGQNFNTIGTLAGSGTTSQTVKYTYLDQGVDALGADLVYYRLRQVDIDGKSELSQVVMVKPKLKDGARVRVWPNPSDGRVQVQLNNAPSGPVKATVYSANGQVVLSTTFLGTTNEIDLRGKNAGTYFIRLEDNNGLLHIEPVVLQ